MDGLTWEEKYLRLRDDHTSLTHKANEQDDTIRRWEDCIWMVSYAAVGGQCCDMNERGLACLLGVWRCTFT